MCQNIYLKWCYMQFTWVFVLFLFLIQVMHNYLFPHKTDFLSVYCTIDHMNNSIFLGSLNMIQPYELCPHWNHNKYQVIAYQTNIRRHLQVVANTMVNIATNCTSFFYHTKLDLIFKPALWDVPRKCFFGLFLKAYIW